MNKELYNIIFYRMEELNAIRKDLSFGCEVSGYPVDHKSQVPYTMKIDMRNIYDIASSGLFYCPYAHITEKLLANCKIIGHPPVLSDCMKLTEPGMKNAFKIDCCLMGKLNDCRWNLSEPYLKDQSDELGKHLFSLLK